MWKLIAAALLVCVSTVAFAHLCNDVWTQAKDNLAVRVEVRDG